MPANWDSPVHSESGATAVAPPPRVASSACTVRVPTSSRSRAVWAMRATRGWASRASMVSRAWIVDSAPELRFTVPSAAMPSTVVPVAGS